MSLSDFIWGPPEYTLQAPDKRSWKERHPFFTWGRLFWILTLVASKLLYNYFN